MIDNISNEYFSYNYGKSMKTKGQNFLFNFDRAEEKKSACMCSKCFNIMGSINFSYCCTYSISSCDIPDIIMKTDIIPEIPYLESFNTYCKVCKRVTKHFLVDYGISPIIQLLNKEGYETLFSCEGHSVTNASAYIVFKETQFKLFGNFGKKDKLLKYWIYSEPIDMLLGKSEIRLSEKAPLEYIYSDKYLIDLLKYIKKHIPIKEQNKKERKVRKKKC